MYMKGSGGERFGYMHARLHVKVTRRLRQHVRVTLRDNRKLDTLNSIW